MIYEVVSLLVFDSMSPLPPLRDGCILLNSPPLLSFLSLCFTVLYLLFHFLLFASCDPYYLFLVPLAQPTNSKVVLYIHCHYSNGSSQLSQFFLSLFQALLPFHPLLIPPTRISPRLLSLNPKQIHLKPSSLFKRQ